MIQIARVLLTILILVQGAATVLIDFDRTHATNPRWPGHARFHLVWQTSSTALLSLLATNLIWSNKENAARFYLAAALAAVPLIGFLFAQVAKGVYEGTLYDPDGILPLQIRLRGKIIKVDGNAAAVYCALLVLIFLVALFYYGTSLRIA